MIKYLLSKLPNHTMKLMPVGVFFVFMAAIAILQLNHPGATATEIFFLALGIFGVVVCAMKYGQLTK